MTFIQATPRRPMAPAAKPPSRGSLICGYAVPQSRHLYYQEEAKEWGLVASFFASYQVPGGPRFVGGANLDARDWRASEIREVGLRAAYLSVRAAVEAHNAVVEPIPNH